MKKITILLLTILLCCTAVFAAEVSAKVMVNVSFGSDGFSISPAHGGVWNPMLALSVSDNVAGATLNFVMLDWGQTFSMDTSVWFNPDIDFRGWKDGKYDYNTDTIAKIALGSRSTVSYKNSIAFADITAYMRADLSVEGSSYNLGLGYKPQIYSTTNKAELYVACQANHKFKENYVHIDGLTKFNIEDKDIDLEYALGEADWTFGNVKAVSKVGIDANFTDAEKYFFESRAYSWISLAWSDTTLLLSREGNSSLTAGLRFKYYANDEEKTGVYAYGMMDAYVQPDNKYNNDLANQYNIEAEVGRYGAKLNLSTRLHMDESINILSYVNTEFNYRNENTGVKITDALARLEHNTDARVPYVELSYLDGSSYNSYIGQAGLFAKVGYTTSVGSCAIDLSTRLGFDNNGQFKWNVTGANTVNF